MANNPLASRPDVWAVIPVKNASLAKQRLADAVSPRLRQDLALAMFQDVLDAVAGAPELRGIAVVTADPIVGEIARRAGAEIWLGGAHEGHTGAVTAAARRLAVSGSTLLTIPGDVPMVSSVDISQVIAAHPTASPAFTIVPAWDELGSNTIVCSPADAVPLRFGPDSYFPHLAAARAAGVTPTIVRNDAIALDIDEPSDLKRFMQQRSGTRSWKLLDERRAEWDHEASVALASQ
jgi:2-phospho-L-lactate/phosphoenolpyruvate guanylyltransferase